MALPWANIFRPVGAVPASILIPERGIPLGLIWARSGFENAVYNASGLKSCPNTNFRRLICYGFSWFH